MALTFFGDGGANQGVVHETMNLASVWKLPFIFLCENNKYALSTDTKRTTAGEIAKRAAGYDMPHARVDGNDVLAVYEAVKEAVARARRGDGPTFVEAVTYRWGGHSMRANLPDYRTKEEEREWIERDPIVRFGHGVVEKKTLTPMRLKELEQAVELTLDEAVRFGTGSPEPTVEMMEASVYAPHAPWEEPKARGTRQLAINEALNEALHQEMARDSRVFVMGEDVALIGGIFQVTKGLRDRFGEDRVRDTPISEATFVGAGVGAAVAGMRPVVEIQIWDFIAMTMDQVVNQAAKFRYMLGGTPTVPLVIRGPQGGGIRLAAQHSQSLEAWFTHVPGLVVIAPSTPYDAKGLLTAAIRDDNPGHLPRAQGALSHQGGGAGGAVRDPDRQGRHQARRQGRHRGRDPGDGGPRPPGRRGSREGGGERRGHRPPHAGPARRDDDPRVRRQDAPPRHRARGGQARRLRGRGRGHGHARRHGRAGRADRPRRRAQRADALQRQSRARDDSEQGGHRRRDQVPARGEPDFDFRPAAGERPGRPPVGLP